jgi:hypothetical protein
VADPLLSISSESASVPSPYLVFIPCHLEPDVRFSLIRLSDNLHPVAFKVRSQFLLAVRYSLRWSSRDLSCGVIGLAACTVTYFLAEPG